VIIGLSRDFHLLLVKRCFEVRTFRDASLSAVKWYDCCEVELPPMFDLCFIMLRR
jgi:hypothetical protein